MLFIIEDDIVEANDNNFLKCFENLLLGYIEGNHLLFIKPQTVEKIERIYGSLMDEKTKARFIHYQEKFMFESKIAYNLVNYAIKIVPNNIEEKEEKHINKMIGYLHTDKFLTSATIQKTVFLGENPEDAEIYKIFAEEYLRYKNSNLKVQLRIENGGGNTTTDVFRRKIEDGVDFCLTILDSDKKFDNDIIGETAKRIKRETNDILTPKVYYHIEEKCRELENILPKKFYYKKYASDVNKKPIFDKLDSLNTIDNKLIYYFDMKKGLKHFDIRKFSQLSHITEDKITYTNSPVCSIDSFCERRENCQCFIIKGFGNHILRDFIQFYQNNCDELKIIINSSKYYLKKIWIYLGRLVFSWGCGQEVSLANT
jgi:hypothetical protein